MKRIFGKFPTKCFKCGKEIYRHLSRINGYGKHAFCSRKCYELNKRKSGPFTNDEFDNLYYKQELSIREIAEMFGMSIQGIYMRARRLGFKLRSIGNCATERTKEKMSKAWSYEKHITEESKKNISKGMIGHVVTQETRQKISQANTGRKMPRELGERHSKILKKRYASGEIVIWNKDKKGIYSQETIEKIRQARMKQRIPTSNTLPERKFMQMIKDYNLPYKYTGNGEIWIHHKNPDFINVNGKKEVVEIFGRYWHTKGQGLSGKTREENKTKEHYKNYGFDCIVIWDDEIDNKQLVLEKLKVIEQ